MATRDSKEITIAVLPFQVLTDIERLNPIMLGFTEDLITNISKFVGLSVISHLTTQYLDHSNTVDLVEKLGVDYIISGSFRSQGDKVRINFQLIKTEDNSVIFAGHHLETPESIFNFELEHQKTLSDYLPSPCLVLVLIEYHYQAFPTSLRNP